MTVLAAVLSGAALGALGAYALFFSALKAADPAGLARRLAAVEERLKRIEEAAAARSPKSG